MPVCPRCGVAIERGQDVCPACQSYAKEGPRQSASDHPPPAPTDCPPLIPLDHIRRKVRRGQFFRDDVQSAGRTGGLAGLAVGLIVSVVVGALVLLHAAFGPGSSFETFAAALPITFVFGLVGSLAFGIVGYVVALLYITIARPVIAAIFWSVERFEQEYGDRKVQPLRHPSSTRKVNDD